MQQPDRPFVQITVNGTMVSVPQGELVVESVKRLGLEVPIFCYHPRMKPVGMCRMCLVEVGFKQQDGSVRMMPKPQAGCTLPASEGMVVVTDSEALHRDRKGVLEFLLVNHPLDCPVCDRGGECPLQNNTMAYGPSTSRYVEVKRHLPKAFPLSRYVTLDLERCIQCGRCVRFTEEVSGDGDLAFRFRGAQMQPSTFQLTDFESRFSGNVIEICPVGALTSSQYRFRARPWDLEAGEGLCTNCSNGCSVWLDHRAGRFVRLNGRTNDAVNEEWTCDKGKFGHGYLNSASRATAPMLRRGDSLVQCTWEEAYAAILEQSKPGPVAAVAGPRIANEGMWALDQALRGTLGARSVAFRWSRGGPVATPAPGTIEGLESKKAVLVFGTHLAEDLPIVHLRVRKAASQRGAKVAGAYSAPNEVDRFASVTLRYRPGSEGALAASLLSATGAGDPSSEATEAATGIPAALVREAAALLGPDAAIVASDALLDTEDGGQVVASLVRLAEATGAELDLFPRGANAAGADRMGLNEDGAWDVLEGAAAGRVGSLWAVECDPAATEAGRSALEGSASVVYVGSELNETARYATVVLPMAAPAEQDGTWTNCEGRVQRMRSVLRPPGEAKPLWRIALELRMLAEPGPPLFHASDVMDEIANRIPAFGGCAYSTIPPEGALLPPDAAQPIGAAQA
jgi:NADH-quinone oxidoreductase subunit G